VIFLAIRAGREADGCDDLSSMSLKRQRCKDLGHVTFLELAMDFRRPGGHPEGCGGEFPSKISPWLAALSRTVV